LRMYKGKFVALFLALVLIAAVPSVAQADRKIMGEGTAVGHFFSTPEGLSFRIPDGFENVRYKTDNPNFLRIVLERPLSYDYSRAWLIARRTYMVIDIFTGSDNVENYMGASYFNSIIETNLLGFIYRDYLVYSEGSLLYEDVQDVFGNPELESLLIFQITHGGTKGKQYTEFCYGFCWSTENYFVRVCYICYGDQQSLPEDIPKFLILYRSMIVP
jgi:hypothetical protein